MSEQTFARGNVAYNGTGAATSGPVDPTGYVTREQNRSGLAAGAMQRRLSNMLGSPDAAPVPPPSPTASVTLQPHPLSTGQHYPILNPATPAPATLPSEAGPPLAYGTGGVTPTFGDHGTAIKPPAPTTLPAGLPAAARPVAPVGNGTISLGASTPNPAHLPVAGGTNAAGNPITMGMLPSNPQLAAMEDALNREKLTYEGEQGLGLQQKLNALAYQEQMAGEQEPKDEAAALANFGSRGLGFSSGYLGNLGDLKEAMARKVGGYHTDAANAKNDYAMALQRFLDDYVARMSSIQGNQASWADNNLAGTALADVLGKKK